MLLKEKISGVLLFARRDLAYLVECDERRKYEDINGND